MAVYISNDRSDSWPWVVAQDREREIMSPCAMVHVQGASQVINNIIIRYG